MPAWAATKLIRGGTCLEARSALADFLGLLAAVYAFSRLARRVLVNVVSPRDTSRSRQYPGYPMSDLHDRQGRKYLPRLRCRKIGSY